MALAGDLLQVHKQRTPALLPVNLVDVREERTDSRRSLSFNSIDQ
jgi:hypothetical protein